MKKQTELEKKIKKIADLIEVGREGTILDIDIAGMILNEIKYEKLFKENTKLKKQIANIALKEKQDFIKLPLKERRRILAKQAEKITKEERRNNG